MRHSAPVITTELFYHWSMNAAISMSCEWAWMSCNKMLSETGDGNVPGGSVVRVQCQRRRHGSDPSSRKIPPATNHMSHNYWACDLEPGSHNYWVHGQLLTSKYPGDHAPQPEKPLQWEASTSQLGSSLRPQQLEKSLSSHRDSTARKK